MLLGRKAVRDNGTEDVKLLFFEKEEKNDKRHKLFYTFLHTAFLAEPDESGKVTFTLYREQCDKFGQKKKFPKTLRVVLTFTDCEPRDAELSPDDAIFREKKAAYDQYEAEETRCVLRATAWCGLMGPGWLIVHLNLCLGLRRQLQSPRSRRRTKRLQPPVTKS